LSSLVDLYALANWIFDKGFVLVFAAWALWRLDGFLTKLIESEVIERETLRRIADTIEQLRLTTRRG